MELIIFAKLLSIKNLFNLIPPSHSLEGGKTDPSELRFAEINRDDVEDFDGVPEPPRMASYIYHIAGMPLDGRLTIFFL